MIKRLVFFLLLSLLILTLVWSLPQWSSPDTSAALQATSMQPGTSSLKRDSVPPTPLAKPNSRPSSPDAQPALTPTSVPSEQHNRIPTSREPNPSSIEQTLNAAVADAKQAIISASTENFPSHAPFTGEAAANAAQVLHQTLKTRSESATFPEVVISFKHNSVKLHADARAKLKATAKQLNSSKRTTRIEVAGYSDNQGNPQYNLWLSQKRADRVKDYLVAQGMASARLVARGYGATADGRDQVGAKRLKPPRRVEIRRLKSPVQPTQQ